MIRLIIWSILIGLSADHGGAAVVRAWSMMHRWPRQTVPYYIDAQDGRWTHKRTEQPTPWTYDSTPELWGKSIEETIEDGLAMLTRANPGLRFVRLDRPDAKRHPHAVRIRERPEILITGMATANGFSNGRSARYEIHINKWNHAGIVAHEMLHILGVSHGQSAANRETFAIVYTGQAYLKGTPDEFTVPDNVRSGHGNFNLLTGRRILGGYDFDSIMHYSDSVMKKRGSKNPPVVPKVTIGRRLFPGPLRGRKDSLPQTGIHYWEENGNGRSYHAQRSRLSPIDAWALREMYFHTTNPETGADFNGDGLADLIFGSQVIYGGVYSSESPGLDARNLPDAKRQTSVPVLAIIHGDFNGDYRTDAVIDTGTDLRAVDAARDIDGRAGRLGLQRVATRLDVAMTGSDEWAVGDFNGDGCSDLFVRAAQGWRILYGGPNGLGPVTASAIGDHPSKCALAAGDLNGDGYTDLALLPEGEALRVIPGSREGLGTSAREISLPPGGGWRPPVAVGDFDCDGVQDLVVTRSNRKLTVLHGDRHEFDGRRSVTIERSGESLLAADLNGDGYSDLAIGDPQAGESGTVYFIDGSPTGLKPSTEKSASLRYASGLGSSLRGGDFDGNGYVDLVIGARPRPIVRYHGSPHSGPDTVIGRTFPHHEPLPSTR